MNSCKIVLMVTAIRQNFISFLTHPILLACFSSWIIAQFIKTFLNLLFGRIHSLTELLDSLFWKTGGLPSSHSAMVTCLCITVGFRNGFVSDIFMVALGFLFVTIRDALGVRRANGLQAKKLNEIGKLLKEKDIMDYEPVKEVNGHTPIEVFMGVLLGLLVGLAFSVL